MTFEDLYDKLVLKINEQEYGSQDYIKSLSSFSSVLEKLYPVEFNNKKKELGINQVEEKISSISKEVLKDIENFEIDYYKNKIEVELEGNKLTSELVNLSDYIENTMNIKKNSSDFLLTLSFLSRRDNFDMFQIAQLMLR